MKLFKFAVLFLLALPLLAQNSVKRDFSCSDAGSTDAYACSAAVAPSAYVTGEVYRFKANTVNTGAATFNLNSLGAKAIKTTSGGDPSDGAIPANAWVTLIYDGTNMQMQSVYAGTAMFPVFSFCTGAVGTTNAGTYVLLPAGNLTPCNTGTATSQEMPMPKACTASHLYVVAGTAGAQVGSGVMKIVSGGSVTGIGCTLGTGTSCSDLTNTFAFTEGATFRVQVTTGQATDTTANIKASFQCSP